MSAEAVDYFSNHQLKLRFPWSLYHRPIVRALRDALEREPGQRVLNIGSGPFFELVELGERARGDRRFTLCDIDERALRLAQQTHGNALEAVDVIAPGRPLPYADARFDMVISMDVIEHVVDPLPWLREAFRVLKPGGSFFFTTPNYASVSLRALENTVLEGIARLQGFSRRDLHPTKLDEPLLSALMTRAGVPSATFEPLAFGWVLAARGRKI